MNARMPALKACFEHAGFTGVRTVLSSGNVVFDAARASEAALERKAEAAMVQGLGRAFHTIVRPVSVLQELLQSDPFAAYELPAGAKRVVTFLRQPHPGQVRTPIEREGARILRVRGREVFTSYLPSARGPVFMALIEEIFGVEVTTRTWDTVRKCAGA